MIVVTSKVLPINSVCIPDMLTDGSGNFVKPQPCYIIREATKEEYEAQGGDHIGWPTGDRYYEISTD